MKKITLNKDYLFSLYGDAEQNIHEILQEFSDDIPLMKERFMACFKQGDPLAMRHILHANYPGFAYAGFPEISLQIKNLLENCKSISQLDEIRTEFEELLIIIDQCEEICLIEMENFAELQICA